MYDYTIEAKCQILSRIDCRYKKQPKTANMLKILNKFRSSNVQSSPNAGRLTFARSPTHKDNGSQVGLFTALSLNLRKLFWPYVWIFILSLFNSIYLPIVIMSLQISHLGFNYCMNRLPLVTIRNVQDRGTILWTILRFVTTLSSVIIGTPW